MTGINLRVVCADVKKALQTLKTSELRYLQGIYSFDWSDSQGLLSMCHPKFLHQDTKTILKNDLCLIFTVQI